MNIKEELKIMLDRLKHLHEHHIDHEETAGAVEDAIGAVERAHATAPADLESTKTVADPNAPPPADVAVDASALSESGVKGTASLGSVADDNDITNRKTPPRA